MKIKPDSSYSEDHFCFPSALIHSSFKNKNRHRPLRAAPDEEGGGKILRPKSPRKKSMKRPMRQLRPFSQCSDDNRGCQRGPFCLTGSQSTFTVIIDSEMPIVFDFPTYPEKETCSFSLAQTSPTRNVF